MPLGGEVASFELREVASAPLHHLCCGAWAWHAPASGAHTALLADSAGVIHMLSEDCKRSFALFGAGTSVQHSMPALAIHPSSYDPRFWYLCTPSNVVYEADTSSSELRIACVASARLEALAVSEHDEVAIVAHQQQVSVWDLTTHTRIYCSAIETRNEGVLGCVGVSALYVFACCNAAVYCLDRSTGSLLASYSVSQVPTALCCVEECVLVALQGSQVLRLQAPSSSSSASSTAKQLNLTQTFVEDGTAVSLAASAELVVFGLLNGSAVVRSSSGGVRGRAVFASAVVVASLAARHLLCADYNGDVRVYALDGSADTLPTEVLYHSSAAAEAVGEPLPREQPPPLPVLQPYLTPQNHQLHTVSDSVVERAEDSSEEIAPQPVENVPTPASPPTTRQRADVSVGRFGSLSKIAGVLQSHPAPQESDSALNAPQLNSTAWLQKQLADLHHAIQHEPVQVDDKTVREKAHTKALRSDRNETVFGSLPTLEIESPTHTKREPRKIDEKWLELRSRKPIIRAHLDASEVEPQVLSLQYKGQDWIPPALLDADAGEERKLFNEKISLFH